VAAKRAELDSAFNEGDAPSGGKLPPLREAPSPTKVGGGGDVGGDVLQTVREMLAKQNQAMAAMEERMKRQNDEVLSKVAALSAQLSGS
jgi:hypothetical protein